MLGLVLLYFGAEWLVKGSAAIAILLGVTPLVVGLTVVAFGTSAPELLVCLKANVEPGGGDIATGNIVGSNLCNILLVLGASALVFPLIINPQIVRREINLLLVASLAFVAMFYDGVLSRIDGSVLFLAIICYVTYSIYDAKRGSGGTDAGDIDDVLTAEEIESAKKGGLKKLAIDLCLIVVGIAFLVIGTDCLIYGGTKLAVMLSVPKAIIALSLFAFGTSLPELATGLMASWRKEGDIVVGNAVGSCIFNLLAVGGMTSVVSQVEVAELKIVDFVVMVVTVVIAKIVMTTNLRISRVEGAVMCAVYLGYSVYMFVR